MYCTYSPCSVHTAAQKQNNSYRMSITKIAKIVGISIRKVYDCIDELMELNLIEEFSNHKGEKMFHLLFLDTSPNPPTPKIAAPKIISHLKRNGRNL